ncbi:hypothetical protein [Petroclostridium sp. X23]|uniref:hypothetical protein n=1 Tax=Petroclostridium sp. X23 TaxID=3045146 RepID=UPI0024AE08F7|nr:hypothetical protein [Petroclostridium sp. X23]WHH59133.1 hypothetical protein QKW49_25665 [Petroclostridium sp. X23]
MDNSNKIILDLCGGTGSWSKPYKEAGYDVRVITLPDNDVCLYSPPDNVYGILAATPCDQFSIAKHFHGKGNYKHDFKAGLEVASACCRIILTCKPKFWAIENPANGLLKNWLKEPKFIFNPWQYGDNYQKNTALWGEFNIPKPIVTEKPEGMKKFSMLLSKEIYPEYYGIYTRQERRAITPPRFAKAFFQANQ